MNILIVVDEPGDWALEIPEAKIVAARNYLTGSAFAIDQAALQTAGHADEMPPRESLTRCQRRA